MIRGVEMKRFYSICNKQLNEIRVNLSDRESIGLSRGKLSELMGLSVKIVQAWELVEISLMDHQLDYCRYYKLAEMKL